MIVLHESTSSSSTSETVLLVRAILSIQTASTHSECPTLRNPESEDFFPLDEVVNSATVNINTPSCDCYPD